MRGEAMNRWSSLAGIFTLMLLSALSGCTSHLPPQAAENLAYQPREGDSLLSRNAPVFHIQSAEKAYNRIGGISYSLQEKEVVVDPDEPVIYAEKRIFRGKSGKDYTNLIYRVHFQKTPYSLWPFYLGAGENMGLLVIVTLGETGEPLLYTSLHTCGCYLAFVPTNLLDRGKLPENWAFGGQDIYGERLPGLFEMPALTGSGLRLHVLVRDASHRVMDLWLDGQQRTDGSATRDISIQPMTALGFIDKGNRQLTSFFENSGTRTGYVKRSQKFWERLLISWWALDGRVGEDKYLGADVYDGPVFYTSLKPWARKASDLRDFSSFLAYWGFDF